MRTALLASLALLAAPLAAQQRSLTINSFDAAIDVLPSNDIDVSEKIDVTFTGDWHGVVRLLPVDYRTAQGFNWSIRYDVTGATDQAGNQLRIESEKYAHYLKLKIWVPNASNSTRTVTLHYRAHNALRYFEDHDELYWNATGDEWDVPLGMVSAVVHLPAGATGVRTAAYNGTYGAAQKEAGIDQQGSTITFRMPRPLEYREGLTVVVGWDKGLVKVPSFLDKALEFLRNNWPVGVPIPVFLLMFWLWYTRGRDPRLRPIMTLYEPPKGMTPGEAGTLIDESVDMRDITATLVDLAVRGFLTITEIDKGSFIGISLGKDYTLTVKRPRKEWGSLAAHEVRVLEGIFKGLRDSVDLSDLKNEFYTEIGGIQSAVMGSLVDKKYYRSRPDNVRNAWRALGVVFGVAFCFGGTALAARWQMTALPFIVGGVLSGLIILIFGHNMPARSEAGTRALEQVLGYEEFLVRVDSERFKSVIKTPAMFEQGLPYAMALGVDAKWAKAFEGIYTTPPNWYVGTYPGQFSVGHFSSSLSSMTQSAGHAMASQPRSSSGSGFGGGGGGGFSGGGGGGGGGGGF